MDNAPLPMNKSLKTSEICAKHTFSPHEIENLRKHLLKWYYENKRDLPWRRICSQETDRNLRGYAVWVSEVMLQQTQVATVIDYYNKWMKRWPNLQELAKASLEEVNEMWAGLGYYSRGRRLYEGCKKVINEMNGNMPSDATSLMKFLPGVGKYTAAAIASIAFNERIGLVDGNVVRVLSRLRIIGADASSALTLEMFWKLVDDIVAKDHPGDFNQAVMELGATVCTPKSPQCSNCPIQEICLAYRQDKNILQKNECGIKSFFCKEREDHSHDGLTDIEEVINNECQLCLPKDSSWDAKIGVCNYPRKPKAKKARQEKIAVCVLQCCNDNDDALLLMVKRPTNGLLAGLWEFPNFAVDTNCADKTLVPKIKQFIKEKYETTLPENQEVSQVGEVFHKFSHIHHTYIVHMISLPDIPTTLTGKEGKNQNIKWVKQSEFLEMAVSTGMNKVYSLCKNNKQTKNNGVKRKREEKGGGKRQKVLDSFFLRT